MSRGMVAGWKPGNPSIFKSLNRSFKVTLGAKQRRILVEGVPRSPVTFSRLGTMGIQEYSKVSTGALK